MVRHRAALRLLAEGSIDGWVALLLVVAPPPGRLSDDNVAAQARNRYPAGVATEARALRDAGASYVEIAQRLGVPETTIKYWCSNASRRHAA
jgi:DNA-directed RNA polymerase specialized sigma24 family protein